MLHPEVLPIGIAVAKKIDPDFKRALASVQDHVFLATRRPKGSLGLRRSPQLHCQ